jgi:hypothetical protein
MIEFADLAPLRNLHKIKNTEDYFNYCSGPYLVGRITDTEVFTQTISDPSGLSFSRVYLSSLQRKLVSHIQKLDRSLGFDGELVHLTFDQRVNSPGFAQRQGAECWHLDNGGMLFSKTLVRNYIMSSTGGTMYLEEKYTRDNDLWPCNIRHNTKPSEPGILNITDSSGNLTTVLSSSFSNEITDIALRHGILRTMRPFDIYLMPQRVYHKAPIPLRSVKRTFWRLVSM